MMHAQRQCLNLNVEQSTSVHWGPNSFLGPFWHAKLILTLNEPPTFRPPLYYLQACTKTLLYIEGVVCKSTNSQPIVMLS